MGSLEHLPYVIEADGFAMERFATLEEAKGFAQERGVAQEALALPKKPLLVSKVH
jgi:hypothetical protein